MGFLRSLFASGDFMPHGYCYLWQPGLVWLHVVSDSLIALAYFSIPITLVYFIRKRKDLPFNWIFVCFGVFILACGTTHAMEVWTLWHATYWLSGGIKALTALTSVPTAILLVRLVPRALALPSPEALRREITERERAEEALRTAKNQLELRVEERTAELRETNENLLAEIAQRVKTEQELRRSEEQLRLAQNASGSGAWDWNPRTDLATWSEQHSLIFGLEPGDSNHTWSRFLDLVHPEDRTRIQSTVLAALRPDGELETEYRIQRPDGEIRWVISKGRTYCDATGEPIRMIGLTQDITERKRLEQALLQTQTEVAHLSRVLTMGELTSSIAHEVNQPLAAVVANGDACRRWLDAEPPNIDKARECAAWIVKEGNRASQVVQRVRVLAKKASPQEAKLDINEVVREVIGLVGAELARNHVSLETDLAPNLPVVFGDRVQLQQVILNLIANGIDAMSSITGWRRELLVSTTATGENEVVVNVRDCGTGLAPELANHVFQPFFTTKPAGMGLGLSISRRIIEGHGGRLWATPNSLHGVTFQFTLSRVVGASA
jgi:PAS domain S-box-containing protein